MINLLPQEVKKYYNKLYKQRVASMVLYSAIIVMLIGVLALLPSYIIVRIKESVAENQIQYLESTEAFAVDKQIKEDVRDINKKLKLVEQYKDPFVPSESIIDIVLDVAPVGISFENIEFIATKEELNKVALSGVSNTRDTLQKFKDILVAQENFSDVVLPVGSFAGSRDIHFKITLTVKKN